VWSAGVIAAEMLGVTMDFSNGSKELKKVLRLSKDKRIDHFVNEILKTEGIPEGIEELFRGIFKVLDWKVRLTAKQCLALPFFIGGGRNTREAEAMMYSPPDVLKEEEDEEVYQRFYEENNI